RPRRPARADAGRLRHDHRRHRVPRRADRRHGHQPLGHHRHPRRHRPAHRHRPRRIRRLRTRHRGRALAQPGRPRGRPRPAARPHRHRGATPRPDRARHPHPAADDGRGAPDHQPGAVPAGQPAVPGRRAGPVPPPAAVLRGRGRMRLPRLKSFRDRNQVAVGVVALAVLAAATATVFAVGTSGVLEDRYRLTAVFDRTGGLATNADVRVAGVPVGTVTGIDADFTRGHVLVTFEVDRDVDPETTAEIAAATLLGGYYLRLDGPVGEPYLADLDPDDERRQIPLERTQGPTSLNRVLEDTTETVSAIDFEAANRVLQQVAGAADRNVEVLPALIDDFTTIATALAARDAELRQLAAGAEQLTATLAGRDQQLAVLVETSDRLLDELVGRRDELSAILVDGSAAVGQMATLLAEHRTAIDQLIGDVGTITAELADTLPDVNRALTQARTLFPLLVGTLDPAGGFSVRGEGLLVHPGQVENILDVVDELLRQLGVRP